MHPQVPAFAPIGYCRGPPSLETPASLLEPKPPSSSLTLPELTHEPLSAAAPRATADAQLPVSDSSKRFPELATPPNPRVLPSHGRGAQPGPRDRDARRSSPGAFIARAGADEDKHSSFGARSRWESAGVGVGDDGPDLDLSAIAPSTPPHHHGAPRASSLRSGAEAAADLDLSLRGAERESGASLSSLASSAGGGQPGVGVGQKPGCGAGAEGASTSVSSLNYPVALAFQPHRSVGAGALLAVRTPAPWRAGVERKRDGHMHPDVLCFNLNTPYTLTY